MVTVVVLPALELVILAIQFPVAQVCHLGIPKLSTAADEVPLLVTVASSQASNVVVVPTVIVAASQSVPSCPSVQATHSGMLKFNTAAVDVQELVTVAELQGVQVDTVPTVIVAAVHGSPCSPFRLEY